MAGNEANPGSANRAGTRPNPNVSSTNTGALDRLGETSEIPVGNWIVHSNGWTEPSKAELVELANGTTYTYSIDDTEFVPDSFDDWEFVPERKVIRFEYVRPPKPKGTTYEVRWEVDANREEYAYLEDQFPYSNQVDVVGRK